MSTTTSIAMHWIDGKWVDSDEHRDSVNPATGEVIGSYAMGGPKEAQAEIEAAKRAFADPAWRTNRLLRAPGAEPDGGPVREAGGRPGEAARARGS
jgi:betaine-aldehyde dehydrogenase